MIMDKKPIPLDLSANIVVKSNVNKPDTTICSLILKALSTLKLAEKKA